MNPVRNLTKRKQVNFLNFKISISESFKKLIVLVFIFSLTFPTFPVSTNAAVSGPVPVSDGELRTKEVGITLFGVTVPGISYDSIAYGIAKIAIQELLNATTQWVNNGFEGNPAYATDPEQFFTNLADNIAGEFIRGSDLGFLCSPFQLQIRLALQASQRQQQFQCSLTDVVENIEGFYGDFDQGGWDGWFAMTQNTSNNPYGAYVKARIELNQRIADALGLQQEQLRWNNGFLSWSECTKEDPDTGECYERGPVKTPGSIIEDQLALQLGTGVRQLELADEFNELVGALFVQIVSRVFSDEGVF